MSSAGRTGGGILIAVMNRNSGNVSELAARKEDANFALRAHLKMQGRLGGGGVDRLVAETARRIAAQFDGTTCGNCCGDLQIGLSAADVQRLAATLGLSGGAFGRTCLAASSAETDAPLLADEPELAGRRPAPYPLLRGSTCKRVRCPVRTASGVASLPRWGPQPRRLAFQRTRHPALCGRAIASGFLLRSTLPVDVIRIQISSRAAAASGREAPCGSRGGGPTPAGGGFPTAGAPF